MRAVVIERLGGPEVLRAKEWPDPSPGPGQLLVEVAAAGVNYRDVYERTGTAGYATRPPIVAGVEGAGTVREAGDGVDEFSPGDRVVWCSAPGSYAGLVLVDAAQAVPVPDGVTDEQAAAVTLQGITAHYLSTSTYPVREGDTVLVHAAAGGVGLLLTQMVKLRGGRVLATTSTPQKAELATSMGADHVIGYEGFGSAVRELTGGDGVAAAYDGVGQATFDESLGTLRVRGTMVLFGSASGPAPPVDPARLAAGSLSLTRPMLAHHVASRGELLDRAGAVLGWLADGSLRVVVGGRYPLEEARRAHEDLESRATTGKLLLLPR